MEEKLIQNMNGILKLLRISEKKDMLPGTLSGGHNKELVNRKGSCNKASYYFSR